MISSSRIIEAAKTGRPLFDNDEAQSSHLANLVVELDRMRSADPVYMMPHNVLWRHFLSVEHVSKWASMKINHPEWTEAKRHHELSPYGPEKLVCIGKDLQGNDVMVCESQAIARWSPYPGMIYD